MSLRLTLWIIDRWMDTDSLNWVIHLICHNVMSFLIRLQSAGSLKLFPKCFVSVKILLFCHVCLMEGKSKAFEFVRFYFLFLFLLIQIENTDTLITDYDNCIYCHWSFLKMHLAISLTTVHNRSTQN